MTHSIRRALTLGLLLVAPAMGIPAAPAAADDECLLMLYEAEPGYDQCNVGTDDARPRAVCASYPVAPMHTPGQYDWQYCAGPYGVEGCTVRYAQGLVCVNTFPGEGQDACVRTTCVDGPGEIVGAVVGTVGDPACTPPIYAGTPICIDY